MLIQNVKVEPNTDLKSTPFFKSEIFRIILLSFIRIKFSLTNINRAYWWSGYPLDIAFKLKASHSPVAIKAFAKALSSSIFVN